MRNARPTAVPPPPRGAVPTAWETCARLLAGLPEDRAVVCAALPGSWTALRMAQTVAPDRLFRFAPHAAVGMAGADEPVFVLGDEDATWRRSAPLPWLAPSARRDVKIRRLDTLLDERQAPGLVVIEAAADAPAVLRGGAGLLAGPRPPAILLDLAASPRAARPAAWAACAAALTGAAYTWHDGRLVSGAAPGGRSGSPGAGDAPVACALPRGWPIPPPVRDAGPEGVEIRFDADLPTDGFYPPEPHARATASRWSGPAARAAFVLPCPGPGRWDLRLVVRDWGVCGTAAGLRLFAEGRALRLAEGGDGHARYSGLAVPPDAPAALSVELVTPPPRRRAAWDPRRFGVEIAACALVPA